MKSDLEMTRRLKKLARSIDAVKDKSKTISSGGTNLPACIKQGVLTPRREDIRTFSELVNHYSAMAQYSESAGLMMHHIYEQGWIFHFDDLGNSGYFIDTDEQIIYIDHAGLDARAVVCSDYFYAACMMNVLRGLRDAWQENRWLNAPRTYHPESILMLEKLRAADSDITAIILAGELQIAGQACFARHVQASEDAAMARAIYEDLHDMKSRASSAYRKWFLDEERVNTTDHETLCYLDSFLEDSPLSNPFGQARLTPVEIVRMGCFPDGTSYLAGYGEAVLRDPVFAGLGDPVNQAHYYHILRDMDSYVVNGVPFRSASLAARIFPEDETVIQE